MAKNPDSEAALEAETMSLLESLGYGVIDAQHEYSGGGVFNGEATGRETSDQVVLLPRLKPALQRLNPELPAEAIDLALEILLQDHSLKDLTVANKEIYDLLKDRVRVTVKDEDGADLTVAVDLIDWEDPSNNDWLAVQQFPVGSRTGLGNKRADIILFVNGIPLGFIELKAFHHRVDEAYNGNLSDYKDTIPHLFWYNAFVILSNGRASRIGSMTTPWEHFGEWKRISDEDEMGRIELETMVRGTCEPSRMLDLVENFVLFKHASGGVQKLLARNHQYLGVNNAIEAVQSIRDNQGRLGVFWHTQGAGKSFSMVFLAEKVFRKLRGNWTFLIVTDRQELDKQIYQNFADVGAVPQVKSGRRDVQAQTGENLKRLLRGNNRYVFTLIQKFHTRDGEPYPVLSERKNIIVMTDEAHRSQYAKLAANMRRALPNAAFIGFTGTPLIKDEDERTREVFGEYVSVYDFKQSVDDGATVPLYYENRIPALQLINEDLNDDMMKLINQANLDEEQERRLEREFKREYQIITREDRLQAIADDIVQHYMERGFAGRSYHSKAMVVSIDRFTAVRMYDRVTQGWDREISKLERRCAAAKNDIERQTLKEKLEFMRGTDMAVVISQSQNEIALFEKRGLKIAPHRQRIVWDGLDKKFKDPEDALRLVFVCAMWMTGFDAPACSTIYLDKPMRNHTLMQTIARANRTFRNKLDGLIVDYIGVFRNLEKALAIYGTGTAGTAAPGELPVKQKHELIERLRSQIDKALRLCDSLSIDLEAIHTAKGFDREGLKRDAVEILVREKVAEQFLDLVRQTDRLFKAILPDESASEFYRTQKLLNILAQAITSRVPDVDISNVAAELKELLDESVIVEDYIIEVSPDDSARRVDLSQLDLELLRERFEQGRKHTLIKQLEGAARRKVTKMVQQNPSRMDFQEELERMLAEYNDEAVDAEIIFERLVSLIKMLETEEKRAIREGLTEEELAVFDLLTKPEPTLNDEDRETVKKVAQDLLAKLKSERLVLDWRNQQATRAAVKTTIEIVLDDALPKIAGYNKLLFERKCQLIYDHIHTAYFGDGQSVYQTVA